MLDAYESLNWEVELRTVESFFVFQSKIREDDGTWTIATQLWVQAHPFKITAIQMLETSSQWQGIIGLKSDEMNAGLQLPTKPGFRPAVVWQTKERGLRYQGQATVLSLEKPSTARYFGWGEQGGRSFVKDQTFMNYFSKICFGEASLRSDFRRLRQYDI